MAWVTSYNRRYFYRSRRTGGKLIREYLGFGEAAEAAAAEIEQRRQEQLHARETAALERQRHAAAAESLGELCGIADLVMRAVLIGEGFHQRPGGPWRRKRHG